MSEENGNLFERLERDALFSMPEDDAGEEELDVVRALTGAEVEASDLTLGGYIEKHDRVPAFEGADGQPYTVDIDVEETGRPRAAMGRLSHFPALGRHRGRHHGTPGIRRRGKG